MREIMVIIATVCTWAGLAFLGSGSFLWYGVFFNLSTTALWFIYLMNKYPNILES